MANKLELTWVGKDKKISVEPRILIENKDLSYSRERELYSTLPNDCTDGNILIHGDNLLALKSLEQDFAGKIKCVYIDPPYNTGSAFSTYDDNLEHSTWLSLMKPRLELLRRLLSDDGSIWISIDDDEQAYLKVLCDEVFGRNNFVCNVIWQKKFSPQNDAKWLSDNHDYILVYAKNKGLWRPYLLERSAEANSRYKNPDNDPRGPWSSSDMSVRTYSSNCDYPITTPSGRVVNPPESRCWSVTPETFKRLCEENKIWFGPKGNNAPRIKRFLTDVKQGMTATTIWFRDDVGDNQEAKREVKAFNNEVVFATPKPERLIRRVLELATKPGDWVLDSFLGSGTTAAVAHKMRRHWIGVELTNVAYTHDVQRLKKVIDGNDQGGITKSVEWRGGGGYKFYELAPTLIVNDSYGQPIINKEYSPEMLTAAIAKHEGYRLEETPECFWKQAKSEQSSYLFVTTRHVSVEMAKSILTEMKLDEFLLIVCRSYDGDVANLDSRIAIKKIPQSLLKNCEFGVRDYDFHIVCPPEYEDEDDE